MAPVALLLAGGIVIGGAAPLPFGVWAVLGATALAAGIGALRKPHLAALAKTALAAAILAVGACLPLLRRSRIRRGRRR